MLKFITRIKMHIEDQEDFGKYDSGHTFNILEFIENIMKILKQ